MKKAIIIYHSADCDGLCSQAVIRRGIKEMGYQQVDLLGYHNDAQLPDLSSYEMVYAADVCLPFELMKALYNDGRLVWIDHHATSIDASVKYGFNDAFGATAIGKGACELCWKYFFPDTPLPKFVALLSAYDVFDKNRFPWESETLPFQFGVRNAFGNDLNAFYDAIENLDELDAELLIRDGRSIVSYIRRQGLRSGRNYGFVVTLDDGTEALCALTTEFGSIPLQEAAAERELKVIIDCNRISVNQYKISAFAASGESPIHLGEYLRLKYNGGGHHDAAGCVINLEQFITLITDCKL